MLFFLWSYRILLEIRKRGHKIRYNFYHILTCFICLNIKNTYLDLKTRYVVKYQKSHSDDTKIDQNDQNDQNENNNNRRGSDSNNDNNSYKENLLNILENRKFQAGDVIICGGMGDVASCGAEFGTSKKKNIYIL